MQGQQGWDAGATAQGRASSPGDPQPERSPADRGADTCPDSFLRFLRFLFNFFNEKSVLLLNRTVQSFRLLIDFA